MGRPQSTGECMHSWTSHEPASALDLVNKQTANMAAGTLYMQHLYVKHTLPNRQRLVPWDQLHVHALQ